MPTKVTHPHALVHVGPDDLAFGAALLHEPDVPALYVGDAHLYERTFYYGLAAVNPGRCNLKRKDSTELLIRSWKRFCKMFSKISPGCWAVLEQNHPVSRVTLADETRLELRFAFLG